MSEPGTPASRKPRPGLGRGLSALMGDIARACRQPGIARVRVALAPAGATADRRFVATTLSAP